MNSLGFHQNKNSMIQVMRQKVQAVDIQYFAPESNKVEEHKLHHEQLKVIANTMAERLHNTKRRQPRLIIS